MVPIVAPTDDFLYETETVETYTDKDDKVLRCTRTQDRANGSVDLWYRRLFGHPWGRLKAEEVAVAVTRSQSSLYYSRRKSLLPIDQLPFADGVPRARSSSDLARSR